MCVLDKERHTAHTYLLQAMQGRRKIWKYCRARGASSNVVGIICPPGWGRATTTTRIELAHARLHELACVRDICHWTIYSPTTFLERCRKVVREKWLEKSGSRNLVREKWLARKKVVLYYKSTFFQVGEKWLTRKKNTSLKNHFSRTTFLHFSRKVVAE